MSGLGASGCGQAVRRFTGVRGQLQFYLALQVLLLGVSARAADSGSPAEFERYGIVRYQHSQTIYSGVDGVLDKVHVKAGQHVAVGEKLVTTTPIDPSFRQIVVTNTTTNGIVSRVEQLEGKKIDSFDEILVVADDSRYIVVTNIAGKNIRELDRSNTPLVTFNPGSLDTLELSGSIYAVHEPPQGGYGLFKVEVLVVCPDSACMEQISSGDFAKVTFNRSPVVANTESRDGQAQLTR